MPKTRRKSRNSRGGSSLRMNVGGSQIEIAGTAMSVSTTWVHVVGVWDGSNMTLYQDGTLTAGPTCRHPPPTSPLCRHPPPLATEDMR